MNKELSKAYEANQYEDAMYTRWEESGFFNPDICVEKGVTEANAKPFTIVLPPPNATGSLHIGHAMMLAIEDLMIRYHRMKGDKALWIPGTDHAAIATNAIVERQLAREGKCKEDLGREPYVARVKEYIANSQDNIRNQVRKMGSSLDWSREAYTWDEGRNHAVRTMFKKMYHDGLIYRGYRIVNWCPHCHSTLADDEVEYTEQKSKFYYIKFGPVIIGTARPETKFLDKTIIVHPDDVRYVDLVGKEFEMEWIDGKIMCNVIADPVSDQEFGTGAMTITPAHSFEDYELAQKYHLPIVQIIDEDGNFTEVAGKFAGKNARESREAIVEILKQKNLLERVDDEYTHNLSVCYRCKNAIEPLPSKQWFIEVNKQFDFHASTQNPIIGVEDGQKITLKQLMQQVVNNGQIEIIPERFNKIYFHWIDNLRDWCISRQIWVGHQIPVWYKKDSDEVYVDVHPPQDIENWEQDPDNLDTWFSSGLWTFSTLGWPDMEAKDLNIYHPTTVLETMFDILFFWVARMIMMSTYALGEIPFEKVYLHARVLDRDGEKMSKSKPETMIDPLEVCKKYGTDAVRLSLLIGVGPGADVRMSLEKIEGFRNFTNKLWNISRFMLLNIEEPHVDIEFQKIEQYVKTLSDAWILERLETVRTLVTENLEQYNFSYAGEALRDFTWNELADWYLEIAKVESAFAQATADKGHKSIILNYILHVILKLWHPFMPFVTEAIWQEVYGADQMLMVEKWPQRLKGFDAYYVDNKFESPIEKEFSTLQKIITKIRNLRSEYGIEPSKKVTIFISSGTKRQILGGLLGTVYTGQQPLFFIEGNREILKSLARLEDIKLDKIPPQGAISFVEDGIEVHIDLQGAVDVEKETERLTKEIASIEPYVLSLEKKLANIEFVNNAPAQVVEQEKKKLGEAREKLVKLKEQLSVLG